MKNNLNFGFIRRILLILTALSLCISLLGCGDITDNSEAETPEEDKGIESGFYFLDDPLPVVGLWHAACRSEKSVFDIDDVTLTFYYGDYFGYSPIEKYKWNHVTYESYELYFENYKTGDKVLIRHVDEDFVSEKHRCTYRYAKGTLLVEEIIFNHSEELTIPRELFTEDNGVVNFNVYGFGIVMNQGVPYEEGYTNIHISHLPLYYEKIGDTIKLTKSR